MNQELKEQMCDRIIGTSVLEGLVSCFYALSILNIAMSITIKEIKE